MYTAHNGGGSENALEGLAFAPQSAFVGLYPYVANREMWHCPDSTPAMRKKFGSTFFIDLTQDFGRVPLAAGTEAFLRKHKEMGQQTPIIICNIHDELYYGVAEADVHPTYQKPFQIVLKIDGSIKKGRTSEMRSKFFTE
jgi:hypothetical protein